MSAPVQLDLLDLLAEGGTGLPLCLRYTTARGPRARLAEFRQWQHQHGAFGSAIRAHAWTPPLGEPPAPASACCAPAVLCVDLRHHANAGDIGLKCGCTVGGEYLWRGACAGCTWEGPVRPGVGAAGEAHEDALAHAQAARLTASEAA